MRVILKSGEVKGENLVRKRTSCTTTLPLILSRVKWGHSSYKVIKQGNETTKTMKICLERISEMLEKYGIMVEAVWKATLYMPLSFRFPKNFGRDVEIYFHDKHGKNKLNKSIFDIFL